MEIAREALCRGDVVMGGFTAALVNGIKSGAADRNRKGKILLSDLSHYLRQVDIGSTPQFYARKASGDPLISFSPATATPLARLWRLVEMLKDADEFVRQRAADALGSIGPNAAEAVPALAGALEDPDAVVRSSAAAALGSIGPNAAGAVPALADALKDRNEEVRQRAADALGSIGPNAAGAVPALADALKDRNEEVRQRAAGALGSIGPNAAEAVMALTDALKDRSEDVRQRAANSLNRILGRGTIAEATEKAERADQSASTLDYDAVRGLEIAAPTTPVLIPMRGRSSLWRLWRRQEGPVIVVPSLIPPEDPDDV
jgi:HEAT repeat protein